MSMGLLLAAMASFVDPAFVLETAGAKRITGKLVQYAADGSVQVGNEPAVPVSEFVALRRPGAPPLRCDDRPHVALVHGDCIPGKMLAIERERLRFAGDLGSGQDLSIPIAMVSIIRLTPRGLDRRTPTGPRLFDRLQLTNGDKIDGTIVVATEDVVRIQSGAAMTEVARERIEAIAFSTELARGSKPKSPYYRLVLSNGTRCTMQTVTADGGTLSGAPLFGGTIRVPIGDVAGVWAMGGPAAYLSDLKPTSYESTPFFGLSWPMAADANVAGGELRLAGGSFDKGLGLHSACRATFAVPPGTMRFESLAGLDEVTGRRGAVVLRLLADGQTIANGSFDLAGPRPPAEIRLDMPAGAKEFTIVVEFGPGGDVEDHVNLADARFIVSRQEPDLPKKPTQSVPGP